MLRSVDKEKATGPFSLTPTGCEKTQRFLFDQLKLGDYSERAMKIALVAWVGHRAGTQCSLVPLFQYLYCTVLKKNLAMLSTFY